MNGYSVQFGSGSSHGKVCATWRFILYFAPTFSRSKEVIINLKNEDDECFKWAIRRALNPAKEHSERVGKIFREKTKVLNWEGLKFPVNLSDINKFENHNSSISVNVFGYDKISGLSC